MYYKVRIKSLPKAKVGYQVDGSLKNDISSFGGKNIDLKDHSNIKVTKSITAVPRKDANLEAEGGETVIGNIDGSKIPSFFNIEGPRHTKGGVPLNLPDDSFIFSDTKAMMITDPTLLKMFNMPKNKGGYTPAEMSKKFDINKYREILQNKNSDKLDIKTAEMMIKNHVMKLGALALAQESKKGFPQGIPKLSEPYMEANGITEEDLIPKKETQQPNQQSQGQSQKNQPTNMPNGEPVAQSQEEMMRYGGGIRRLRRAQEGMQQPSEEEMMMMQQQQAQQQVQQQAQQQPQQQGGQDQQMMQIMQQVAEALQQGAEPEELTVELLQGQISPEAIMQIFAQLGMPQEQVQQLVMGVIQQMQGGQEQDPRQQMDPRQQQQEMSEEEMMAMQQQDPRQMQQAPMAAYGMSMGGYDMPFYDDPYEMAYGGSLHKAKDGVVTPPPKRNNPKKLDNDAYSKDTGTEYKDDIGNYKVTPGVSGANVILKDRGRVTRGGGKYTKEDVCAWMTKVGGSYYGVGAQEMIDKRLTSASNLEYLKGCELQAVEERQVYTESVDKPPCYCLDPDGKQILKDGQPIILGRDAEGNCIKDDPKCHDSTKEPCYCLDKDNKQILKDGKPIELKRNDDGTCKTDDPICHDSPTEGCEEGTDVYNKAKAICDQKGLSFDIATCDCVKDPEPPEWWLQDTVNVMGAASDLASVKKYMPWEARVDLEEPRPTFLDPTRELGQQSEQANIAAQASASFAGAQGLGARNAASQGQGAAQAANTLSNINNQNVNIANQFEGTQVGIRNQESMLNQQMTNRVFDKNTIANQQFDNAKLAGRQNLRNSYNTAVTNKWKTDALNQMYPNYQTRPGVGGRVIYTPTDKKLDTTKRKDAYDAAVAHCEDQGYAKDKGMTACVKLYMDYHSAQYGGESFENGGYVYTVYPNY